MRTEKPPRRLLIVPRWGGGPDHDCYPWLVRALAAQGGAGFDEVRVLAMPSPGEPTITAWPARIAEVAGADPAALGRTVVMGHSVGCQAVLRWLATLPAGVAIEGALFVAGWFWVDAPWPTIRPWMDVPLDLLAARAACRRFVVLISDDDPFTAGWEANQKAWEERLGARVRLVSGAKHFNAAEEPAVLDTLLADFGGPELSSRAS